MDAVPGSHGTEKYDGVVPGSNSKNPLPPAPSDRNYLVWTGFRMTDSGSQVFLQTTRQVTYETKEEKRGKSGNHTLVILLRDCRIYMANNRRSIDTRYFATPVARVSARQRRANVEVRIVLREDAMASARTEEGSAGSQFLLFDFPPGKATIAPEPDSSRLLGPEEVQNSRDSAEPTPAR